MLNSEIQKLAIEKKIAQYRILKDIDGPGIGNSAIEEKEERPESGGIYIYLYGYKYPYKGMPDNASVEQFRIVKKVFLYLFISISNRAVMALLGILYLLPRFLTKKLFHSVVNYFYLLTDWLTYDFLLKPNRYCICVRELYRTFTVIMEKEKDETMKKVIGIARDIVCLFIEQDSAYKFRFQDIMAEVDICKLKNGGWGMVREIQRLIRLMQDREINKWFARQKWGTIEKMMKPAFLAKELRHYIHEFLREVDFNKLKPDEGDWYFDTLRLDYDFGGKTLPERIEERKKMDIENWNKYNFDELAGKFLTEYNTKKGVIKIK